PLTRLGEGDDGRRGAGTFRVGDNYGLAALHDSDDRVGRPQVDSYGLRHMSASPPDGMDWVSSGYLDLVPRIGGGKTTFPLRFGRWPSTSSILSTGLPSRPSASLASAGSSSSPPGRAGHSRSPARSRRSRPSSFASGRCSRPSRSKRPRSLAR